MACQSRQGYDDATDGLRGTEYRPPVEEADAAVEWLAEGVAEEFLGDDCRAVGNHEEDQQLRE
jgi:hypothetical protein